VTIRSVLWIGSAKGLTDSALHEAPHYDVVWERDAENARALPLSRFDAIVIEARDTASAESERKQLGSAARRAKVVLCRSGEIRPERVLEELDGLDARRDDSSQRSAPETAPPFIASSRAMRHVLELASRAATSRATVLVTGETGTGKELVARAIHEGSARSRHAFVAVNCAAFPDTLLESELLGHVRGAFSGAERDRKGLIEEANQGTLFLDEVAETSPSFQAKLLRVLQERRVRPVGANREREVDVRVVAATHRDLRRAVREGRFREDLYYRVAVLGIHIPPLRERREDVLPLADHLLERHQNSEGKPGCRLGNEIRPLLESHHWPGNVRELENEIQRALALAEPGDILERVNFSEGLGRELESLTASPLTPLPDEPLRDTLARVEALLIRRALQANGDSRSGTARKLGLTREGLYKKMKRLGIE
jgi:transcriptional regulator with PAS, ATPase and Fis domain